MLGAFLAAAPWLHPTLCRAADDSSESVAGLIATIEDTAQKPEVRAEAINRLASTKDKKAIPVIIEALEDKSEEVRWMAVARLKEFGPDAIAALPRLLEMAPSTFPFNDGSMAATLASMGPDAIPSLLRLATHEKPQGRLVAAWALGEVGSRLAVPKERQEAVARP